MNNLFLVESTSTLLLTGLIWTIQLVHYPSFHWIDPARFSSFARFHQNRISCLVLPLMLLELATTVVLAFLQHEGAILRLTITVLIWSSTFFLSVPLHNLLLNSPDPKIIQRLVITNWPRTVLWSIRTILCLYWYKA